jgi:hypothetical protein
MRTESQSEWVYLPNTYPRIPVLDGGDLPTKDDWAVLESLHVDHSVETEFDPESDRFAEVMVSRDAFD